MHEKGMNVPTVGLRQAGACPTDPLVAELSLRIPGGPGAPAEARSALGPYGAELCADVLEVVTLLTSELVANAVRHGGAGFVELTSAVEADSVRVEVADSGDESGRKPVSREPDHTGGWGLYMVEELASRWGVAGGRGTRVWFEIDRSLADDGCTRSARSPRAARAPSHERDEPSRRSF